MADAQGPRPILPGEDVKIVTLREFEQRNHELRDEFKRELAHERELREEITSKLEDARKLNATEIFRRLDELNHAHAQAMENWARSLPRELFDQWEKDYDKWRIDVGTTLTMIAPHSEQINGLISQVAILATEVNNVKPVSSHVQAVDARVVALEWLVSKITGAGILLGLMGLSGVLALVLGLARLAGAVK